MIQQQKEAAAAEAELHGLELENDVISVHNDPMPNDNVNRSINVPRVSARERTKDYVSNSIPYNGSDNAAYSDFTRHMLRQELVTSRLTRFDDRAEHYKSWKETFKDVVLSLDINANEQIDLLIKWLGPESNKHARSIKSISVSNPEDG